LSVAQGQAIRIRNVRKGGDGALISARFSARDVADAVIYTVRDVDNFINILRDGDANGLVEPRICANAVDESGASWPAASNRSYVRLARRIGVINAADFVVVFLRKV
jgi:hypothetical protein